MRKPVENPDPLPCYNCLMIPNRNWDILIGRLRAGDTILEACAAAQVSKPTLYRRLGADHGFKAVFDEAIFHANGRIDAAREKVQEKNWEEMKRIALRKR